MLCQDFENVNDLPKLSMARVDKLYKCNVDTAVIDVMVLANVHVACLC